jgi:hypothetical protein
MARPCSSALLGLAALALVPDTAAGQALPDPAYFVENSSSAPLRCRYKAGDGAWGRAFTLRPGGEFELERLVRGEVLFFCEAPARRVSYRLAPGRRFALLRAHDGLIDLREITAGGG